MIGRSVSFFSLFRNKAPQRGDVFVPFLSAAAARAKKSGCAAAGFWNL